ncbi:FG-GAP-like repeat-containing protein [Streptomyces sp. NPDC000594]|uniref:FG-GAP and VCBS repeat-containing protein n=1 Tax=Streptomyces sp. NPDC000594 TaxID=3154261 RepID=UPI00332A6819
MTSRRVTRGLGQAAAVAVVAALTAPVAHAVPERAPATAPVAAPVPAKAKPQAKPEDFNGDGYRDVVVSAPGANMEDTLKPGYLAVFYGGRSGPLHERRTLIHQDSPGVPGTAETGDSFGSTSATGDLDRDGYTDLVVSAGSEDVGAVRDAGTVAVLWGGPKGLTSGATLKNGVRERGELGAQMAVGDFDGDGDADLVLSEASGSVLHTLSGPFRRNGTPAASAVLQDDNAIYLRDLAAGDVNGDRKDDLVTIQQEWRDDESVEGRTHMLMVRRGTAQGLGATGSYVEGRNTQADQVTVGDVNKDGYEDLVLGRPEERYQGDQPIDKGGKVTWIPGSAQGPVVAKGRAFNQDSPGIPGAAEGLDQRRHGDRFGTGVTVGDINGDGYAEIVVGVPGEELDGRDEAGAVVVLRGTKSGPTGTGAQAFSQNTAGVPGTAEARDGFGGTAKVVDTNRDGRGELLVSAVGENWHAGSVWVFKPTATGATAKGSVAISQSTLGLYPNASDYFGNSFNQ